MIVPPSDEKIPRHWLYGQSPVAKSEIKFEILDKISPLLLKTWIDPNFPKVVNLEPREGFESYVEQVEDICEKFGFLWLSQMKLKILEGLRTEGVQPFYFGEAKYHFYSFIFNSKALIDSISVILKTLYNLSAFTPGQTDIIRNRKYRKAIRDNSHLIGKYIEDNSKLLKDLGDLRDELIHKRRIPIFVKDENRKAVFNVRLLESKDGYSQIWMEFATKEKPILTHKGGKLFGSRTPIKYVTYKEPLTFYEIVKTKRISGDFHSILDFCIKSLELLKQLVELTFSELLIQLQRSCGQH